MWSQECYLGGKSRATRALETLSCWLELVNNRSCRVKLHVILQGVASVEPLGTEMTGEWHLSAVDEHVLLQMVFHTEPLGTLSAAEGS